jgi:hypothetical protein
MDSHTAPTLWSLVSIGKGMQSMTKPNRFLEFQTQDSDTEVYFVEPINHKKTATQKGSNKRAGTDIDNKYVQKINF